jgi:putative DNA primase/helicase
MIQPATIAEPDKWLVELCLEKQPQSRKSITSPEQSHSPPSFMGPGRRNTDCASFAGFLRNKGHSAEEIFTILELLKPRLGDFPNDELKAIAYGIERYSPSIIGEMNHDYFAKAFVEKFGGRVLYVPGMGFLVFDNKRWTHDKEDLAVIRMVRELADEVYSQAIIIREKSQFSEEGGKAVKAALKAKSADFIKKTLLLAKSDAKIAARREEFDAKKHLFNCRNGTLNLDTYELHPFDPEDKLTHMADVDFDSSATCPAFDRFYAPVLSHEIGEFLLSVFAYALTGTGTEQKFFILAGKPRTGKSTIAKIMSSIFGEFSVNADPSTFSNKLDGQIRNDLARLNGARLVFTTETKSGAILDTPLVKRITGLDPLTARFMYQEHFEFVASCVLCILTNYLPVVDGSDRALERRLCLIKFENQVSEENDDHDLFNKLNNERSGILNRLLMAKKKYDAHGKLKIPPVVRQWSQEYLDTSNLIKTFFEENLVNDVKVSLTASLVYNLYRAWCDRYGYKPMSHETFKTHFSQVTGIEQGRNNQARIWPGLGLRITKEVV